MPHDTSPRRRRAVSDRVQVAAGCVGVVAMFALAMVQFIPGGAA